MNPTPLVTIAIPAYKGRYLRQSIDSALAQTHRNIEVVVVDDCSPDNIPDIVDEYNDPRLRYIRNEQNLGAKDPSQNWNRCLEAAQGEWFCLLCDDDQYAPDFVEALLRLSTNYPSCNVLRACVRVIDKEGKQVSQYPPSPNFETLEQYLWDFFNSRRRQTISEFMFRRAHMQQLGGYVNMPFAWGSDNLSLFRFACQGGIASVPEPLVTFRDSGENISSDQQHMDLKLHAFHQYIQKTKRLIAEQHFRSDLLPVVEAYYRRATVAHMREASWADLRSIIQKKTQLDLKTRDIVRGVLLRWLH